MADEPVDTPATPQGTEPEPTQEPVSTPEPEINQEPTPEPAPVQAPTPEEIEERAFQRTASWMGRREKEFSDNILRNVTQVIESRLSQVRPAAPPPAPVTTDPTAWLENPEGMLEATVPRIIEKVQARQTEADIAYNADLVRQSAQALGSYPIFLNPKGEPNELGNEVVQEMLVRAKTVDKRLPADVNARLLVSESLAAVSAKRITTRQNALAGNKPATGIGTITAPGAPPASRPAPVKLDDMAKKVANWFGNSEEEVREFLK